MKRQKKFRWTRRTMQKNRARSSKNDANRQVPSIRHMITSEE